MNVVVCVKQIPDPAVPGELTSDNRLKRDGAKAILDESDSYGVEMALQLVDKAGSGEVILVSMAPNGEVSGLRQALAMGAARAILVSDDALAGADALTTSKVIAKAVERAGALILSSLLPSHLMAIPAQSLHRLPSCSGGRHLHSQSMLRLRMARSLSNVRRRMATT